jgi:protein-L-isoaspartate O-methyltransferase
MHASCLEALQLQPGHRFLDVGSGCGILVAAGAYLVGKTGLSVGIDIKKAAIKMGNANLKALQENNQEFASVAAPWKLELRNVFLPSRKHMGQYDRVHVGAACPPDRLSSLLPLLRPTGGSIVTPVSPSDLRLITKDAQGNVTQQVLSQVRYSDLEVPSDAEIVLATLKMERKERTAVPLPPSTFQQDVCSITGSPSSSNASDTSTFTMDRLHSRDSMQLGLEDSYCASPAEAGAKATWSRRMAKLLTSCGSSSSGDSSKDSGMLEVDKSPRRVSLDCSSLGEPDTVLVGADFRIPVHRVVLRTRCDHFKALCSSGMRDADDTEPQVPEHFGKEAVITFVQYLYHDVLDARTDPEHAIAVLHVAHYYGAARLVGLCELVLARELKKCEAGDAETNEAAAALLALSDETGLTHLRSVCLDYIVNHYAAVRAAKAWATLSRSQVDLVADEACRVAARTQELLRSVARTSPMPDRFVR